MNKKLYIVIAIALVIIMSLIIIFSPSNTVIPIPTPESFQAKKSNGSNNIVRHSIMAISVLSPST
ncbi:MAG TPA: hypothetical protein VE089_09375 [Nitrososphaeraceae archaeon]|nr:hypothetical protein [Nitrososphaeraceae archaeon]